MHQRHGYPSAKPVGTPKTRSQVVTELEQAIKTGDVMAAGESGAKLNEIAPASYPVQATAGQSKSREQVKQELAEAIHHGEMMANGEDGRMLNEIYPGLYRDSHNVASDSAPQSGERRF